MAPARSTHCHQGHRLTRGNVYRKRRRDLRWNAARYFWVRECATCVRERVARRYWERKVRQLDVRQVAA